MKKACYLILLTLLLSAAAQAQTSWITQKLDDKLSIKFPAEPQKVIKNGMDSYVLRAKDSTLYSAGILDYKVVLHTDSATLAPLKDTQEFADGLKNGMTAQKPNYTFSDMLLGKWKNYTTYTTSATDNAHKYKVKVQMILIGTKMYILNCRVPADSATQNNEVFLNSVALLK